VIAPPAADVLALDEAIQKPLAAKPHLAEIILLRYYTDLSFEETARAVGSSVSTVKPKWRFARTWLARELGEAPPGAAEADDD
jgi:DNA-directed RNA polymerase specialized sigma24 family protein